MWVNFRCVNSKTCTVHVIYTFIYTHRAVYLVWLSEDATFIMGRNKTRVKWGMHLLVCRLLYFSNFESARMLPWYTNSSSNCSVLITSCKIALINLFYSYISFIAFIFSYQLNFVLQDHSVRADRSASFCETALKEAATCMVLQRYIWVVEMFCFRKTEKNRASTSMTCLLSSTWAEWQQWQSWWADHPGNPVAVLLAQSPSATLGKVWLYFSITLSPGDLLLMLPVSNLQSMASLPS